MSRVAVFAALVLSSLAGCVYGPPAPTDTPAIKAADKESTEIRQACLKRYQDGELTMAQSVQCSNPKILAAFEAANYPYMDLMRLGMDARLAGAQRVDRGELSPDEYDRQLGELRKRIAAEMRRRNTEASDADLDGKPASTYPQTADASTKEKLLDGLPAFGSLKR